MEIVELFKDSLTYPTKDWNKLVIFGVLFVISNIFSILIAFGLNLGQYVGVTILALIAAIFSFVISLFISGYSLSITGKTITNVEGDIPELNLLKNFIDGIKVFVLSIVYFIIPVIVASLVAFATGAFNAITQMVPYIYTYGSGAASQMPQELLTTIGFSFMSVFFIGGIFFLIFGLLYQIAYAVLAETESLATAINMVDVFKKIGEIGWGNYIIWIIVFILLSFVIALVNGIAGMIPFIGFIIGLLIISPYTSMFGARALGLIYNESKE